VERDPSRRCVRHPREYTHPVQPHLQPERILKGLECRLSAANAGSLGASGNGWLGDSREISLSSLKQSAAQEFDGNRLILEIARYSLKFKSLADQWRFLDQFGTTQIASLTKLLTVGVYFATPSRADMGLELAQISDSDYSLIAHPALFDSPASENLALQIRRQIRSFLKARDIRPAHSAKTVTAYLSSFGMQVGQIGDLHTLSTELHSFRQRYWPIVGSDVLSGLLALCDPTYDLTASQLERCAWMAEQWQLDNLLFKLVLLRALGGYQAELQFIRKHQNYLGQRDIQSVQTCIRYLLDPAASTPSELNYKLAKSTDFVNNLILSFVNVGLATRNKTLEPLKEHIVNLYSIDPLAPAFLDWGKIHAAFDLPSSESDPSTILIKSLMSTPVVAKRFRAVAIKRGRGQIVADLSSFVLRLRLASEQAPSTAARASRSNNEFVRRVRALPRQARFKVMEEVLDKGMAERIAFAFPTSFSLLTKELPRVDNHASILRLELANLARREKAIDPTFAAKIIEEETQFLRMHRFHTFFRDGRIKVDWDHLTHNIAGAIEGQFDFILFGKSQTDLHPSILRNVVLLFSEEVSDILLFGSESSLDQALSNNLRHGVVVPRFVRAFNEAMADVADPHSALRDFKDAATTIFESHAKHIWHLHDSVIRMINDFKDYWLAIDKQGEFYLSAKEMISKTLTELESANRRIQTGQLAALIVERFQQNADKFLQQARGALDVTIKPAVAEHIATTRLRCNETPSSRTTSFLDSLAIHIEEAFVEVNGWCNLIKVKTDAEDFSLEDLLQFEAMSLIFSDFKKLHVRFSSFQRKGAHLHRLPRSHKINGAYFEPVQEIVHNLISNAFKHSGLDMNTDIEFSTIADDETLIFRCVNSYSEKVASQISDAHPRTLALVISSKTDHASKDTLSGFKKIRNVCSRVFAREVLINIPLLSSKSRRFIVEIAIPKSVAEVLV
jgi:hypothetical protein